MAQVKIHMRKKITFVMIIMFILFIAVVAKLVVVQFVQGSELQAKAEDLRTRDLPVSAKRGTIYDRNGEKLAVSISADTVTANPSEVIKSGKAEDTALFLSKVLAMDYQTILTKITKNTSFEYIKRKADFEKAKQIQDADLPGINIIEETQRFYPKEDLAAHLLGFAGIDNQGLEGIEISRDDELSGTAGSIVSEYDAKNREIPQTTQKYVAPSDGYDLVLTIDENIQYFCERELDKLIASTTNPKKASILVMDPNTGEILAMACRPTYDPNNYQDADQSALRNSAISDSYEPGSTFKIITAATALEEGVVTPSEQFYDPGYFLVSGHKLKCWRYYNPHGSETFAEAVENSCNPVFAEVGLRIESKQKGLFYKYIRAFGFGQKTGIELSGEANGIMITEEDVSKLNIATISIGQAISVTPIQLITAVSAVANGGMLLEPQIVRQVKDQDGNIIEDFKVKEVRRVISKETSETLRLILEKVVSEGTGSKAYIPGFRVGGKTGTAQKAGVGGYMQGKYVASFIGMAPVNDPQAVVLVIVDEPQGYPNQGGQVAGPIVKTVMEDTLRYLGVAPQVDSKTEVGADSEAKTVVVPGVVNLSLDAATKALKSSGLKVTTSGSGDIVSSQVPAALSKVAQGSSVLLNLGKASSTDSKGLITVPDLTGKRMADAAELLGAMGLKLVASGSGIVYEQSPVPGKKVQSGSSVNVTFAAEEESVQPVGP